MPNYYDLLGVSPDAEPEVVAAAYRALAKKHHPDVNKDSGAADRLSAVNEAYETLGDPAARRAYDSAGSRRAAIEKPNPPIIQAPFAETPETSFVRQDSLVGNVVFLLVGVPIFWTLAVLAAHVLLSWIGTILLEWADASDYSFGQAIHSLREIVQGVYDHVLKAEPARQDVPVTFAMTALASAWLFICSGTATAALTSHAREERAGLPLWTVGLMILLFFAFLTWRRLSSLTPGATLDFRIDTYVTQAAVLAGILFGLRSGNVKPDVSGSPIFK